MIMVKNIGIIYKHDFEDRYLIYSDGRIYSTLTNRFLKTYINKGYQKVALYKKGHKRVMFYVHRLVALRFVEYNPLLGFSLTVNHKDGNKLNNDYTNLEWITNIENVRHAINNTISKFRKKQLKLETVYKICDMIWNQKKKLIDISKELNVSYHAIKKISQGKNYLYISILYSPELHKKLLSSVSKGTQV